MKYVKETTRSDRWLFFDTDCDWRELECHVDDGQRLSLPRDGSIQGRVIAEQAPVRVDDAGAHPKLHQNLDDLLQYRTQSMICVPVMIGGVRCLVQGIRMLSSGR